MGPPPTNGSRIYPNCNVTNHTTSTLQTLLHSRGITTWCHVSWRLWTSTSQSQAAHEFLMQETSLVSPSLHPSRMAIAGHIMSSHRIRGAHRLRDHNPSIPSYPLCFGSWKQYPTSSAWLLNPPCYRCSQFWALWYIPNARGGGLPYLQSPIGFWRRSFLS